jgi:UDP-N-acetylmuramoyl-L-alanyl-D-glutamate--2,6-diaminopimelate ligase
MQKKLSDILFSFVHETVAADGKTSVSEADIGGITIQNLVFDSRDVTPGTLFFALPGTHTNGNIFIPGAIASGADAVVFEGEFDHDLQLEIAKAVAKRGLEAAIDSSADQSLPAFFKVENARVSMAPVADVFYDSPSKKLAVIGVTGTEGKSSTVSFIWQLLRLTGKKAGFISTVQYSLGTDAISNPQHQTTPEAPIVQHHLHAMVENGCDYAVVEASSHGLSKKLNRLGNVLFDCGIFMNVTLEHLEFHKTFEQYRDDKANLFRKLDEHDHIKNIRGKQITVPSLGIVNLEDPSASYFTGCTKHHVYGFTTEGQAGKAAAETGENAKPLPPIPTGMRYMIARNIASARFGISFRIDADGNDAMFCDHYDPALPREQSTLHINAQLPGAFNAYNIMAAMIAVSNITGMSFSQLAALIPQLTPIKGRMTVIDKGQPFEVIVDYAHTPSSFETIFPPVRKRCTGRIFALFGSGGERDLKKRPLQGEIAAQFCDILILADEDPRGEDSVKLLQMIADGAEHKGKKKDKDLFIIPDRKKAIRETFRMARENDIVLLLGKSHENTIIYKDYVMPYDEIGEAETALAELGYRS